MDIIYNGIHLTMCTVDEYSQQTIYDDHGVDYLYTRHRIVGKCIVNGQVEVRAVAGPPVSYKKTDEKINAVEFTKLPLLEDALRRAVGDGAPAINVLADDQFVRTDGLGVAYNPNLGKPIPNKGIYADAKRNLEYFKLEAVPNPVPLSIRAVRHLLHVPRGQLFVFAGTGLDSELLLMSPAKGSYQCDANNGPKPISVEILYSKGEATTSLIQFAIETYVNDANDAINFNRENDATKKRAASPLLSNRFTMRHIILEDQLTTIQVEGEAKLRTDLMYDENFSPDDLRMRLFLPVPFGFVREKVIVEGTQEANGVRYSFEDRQMPVHFPGGAYHRATKISVLHNQALICEADLVKNSARIMHEFGQQVLNSKWLKDKEKPPAQPPDNRGVRSGHPPARPVAPTNNSNRPRVPRRLAPPRVRF